MKLHFRQENLLSKLLGIGLVLRLERQKATERKELLFLFHVMAVKVTIMTHIILIQS